MNMSFHVFRSLISFKRQIFFFTMQVQFSSVAQLCLTLCNPMNCSMPGTAACQASLSITNSQSPPKSMFIELVMPSNHLILCCPLLLLPSIFPSVTFRMDWLDLLAVQGTLRSLLQHHSSRHHFFGTQLSSQSNPHIHT